MAEAITSGASLPRSNVATNQWAPTTTHDNSDPDPEPLSASFEDDPSLYDLPPIVNGHADHQTNGTTNGHLSPPSSNAFPPRRSSLLPDPSRSPLQIALRASILGLVLGSCTLLSIYLNHLSNPLWRLPFFASSLSLFHLLEFYTTALYNPLEATVSAFLLDNGRAYNIANVVAFLECLLHFGLLIPWWTSKSSQNPPPPPPHSQPTTSAPLSTTFTLHQLTIPLGLSLMLLGQTVRSLAMVHAGTNFNHIVQREKAVGHRLVTDGVYAHLRHPSYFGFFWWCLGTQLVLGNAVCLVGFTAVLWRFFARRIQREEELLVAFFGGEYVRYRGRTVVGIPFVG